MSYPVGSRPRVTFTFTDSAGTVYDPSGVTVVYKDPTGAETTVTYPADVTKASTGVYYVDVDTTGKPGPWKFRAYSPVGASGQAASGDITFTIDGTWT